MNYDIDTIIERKKNILAEINIYQKKLITLETELLEIEKKMSNFSETNINDSSINIFINIGNNILKNIDNLKIPKYIKTLIINKISVTVLQLKQLTILE